VSLCDLTSIWGVVCVVGLAIAAPKIRLHAIRKPFVYMYMFGYHLRHCERKWSSCFAGDDGDMGRGAVLYLLKLLICIGSSLIVCRASRVAKGSLAAWI
jgi:hypothetical protein